MVDVVTFVPRVELDARQNLDGFIDVCRNHLTVFGASLNFDSGTWSTGIQRKGKYTPLRLVFSNLATCDSRVPEMMAEPFCAFAKAYVRYQQGVRPTTAIVGRVAAMRMVEAALRETGTSDPIAITSDVLNRSAQLAQERFTPDVAYRTVQQVELMARFVCENRLTATLTGWKNPVKRPVQNGKKVGKDADEIRLAKLPTPASLDALPKAFRLATEPADLIVTSVTAILLSAPDRINEVLLLREACERREVDSQQQERVGLEWYPAKGAEPMIKWIVPSMSGVVVEAIARIRRHTEEARKVARWYENHPDEIYLANEDLDNLREQQWLSMRDVTDILFADAVERTTARNWCVDQGVPLHRRGKMVYVRFEDLETAVLRRLPPGFPVMNDKTGLKYSEALFITLFNTLHATGARFRCIIEPIGQGHIYNRLGARSTTGVQSIFDRCGLFEEDGTPIRVSSHQFRHYLDTLAQMGGMSQLDIAKWSGRKDIRQNDTYDHEPTQSLLARVRNLMGDNERMSGPVVTTSQQILIPRDEFGRLKIPTAHTTDFGYCVHDYAMSPCQVHQDCLNCDEHVCIKGEAEKEKRLRQAHAENTLLLERAEQAVADGEYGAAKWAEDHRYVLTRIEALLAVIDNPAVPRGAVIRPLPVEQASRLDHAGQARSRLTSPTLGLSPESADHDDEVMQ